MVAPARERGLKRFSTKLLVLKESGRSREGAWIENEIDKMFE